VLIGAALLSATTACGQVADNAQGKPARPPALASSNVVPNPPPGVVIRGTTDLSSPVGDQPLTPLQRRTAGDIQLRLFTSTFSDGPQCTPDSTQCVPSWCQPTGSLIAEVSNAVMATAQAGTIIDLEQGSQVSLLNSFLIGAAEHSPIELVMLRVAGDISEVRLTTPTGSDSTAPIKGLAVLAVPGSSVNGTVAVLDGTGALRGSVKLPQPNTMETTACAPQPLPLPKPGQQPANAAAANRAVRAAYAKAFTAVPGDDGYSSLSAVQDGASLHSALDQLRHNFAQAAASSSVDTGQLVFTDPQTAVLKFTLHYTGGAPYGTHNGTAVFADGGWKVSKDTYCAVLSFGGATCPGS
jgi:hypothetical protein